MPPQPPWTTPLGVATPQPRLMITPSSPGGDASKSLPPLGRSIGLAVELVASVGETIMSGEENCGDMQEACREARAAASDLEKLCEMGMEPLVRTLRRLLAAVTRILLLADNVVVKQLLNQSDKPMVQATTAGSENNLMNHFNEFVKAFCDFGSDMLHLIRITTGL